MISCDTYREILQNISIARTKSRRGVSGAKPLSQKFIDDLVNDTKKIDGEVNIINFWYSRICDYEKGLIC